MRKILFVDDEQNILNAIGRNLKKDDQWQITMESDVVQALELVTHENFDVIISDYKMPAMNGVEFLVFSRENNPQAKRMILSGQTDFSGLVNAINRAGIYHFLTKPLDSNQLQLAIENALTFKDLEENNTRLSQTVEDQKNQLDIKQRIISDFERKHPQLMHVERTSDGDVKL